VGAFHRGPWICGHPDHSKVSEACNNAREM